MSEFYAIDSVHVSLREYWWGNKSPLVIIGWLLKWLRVRIPSSSDDPNVSTTLPFTVEALPTPVAASFEPLAAELAGLGFIDPVYHAIYDPGTRTTIYWATFCHTSGRHFARIHHRVWQQAQRANRALFPMFFTAFVDNTFLVSSAGKPDMAAPGTVQMNRMHGAKVPALWSAHERRAEALAAQKAIAPVISREELLAASERHHLLLRDFHLLRRVFRPRTAAEQARAEKFVARVTEAQASGLEHAEILAELSRLQEQKPGWSTAVWVLVGSFVAFLAAGVANWDWKFTLWIIPVLLFHEAGHWVAMRLCQYRNLRMFFIPFFGAAVSGQNWNVPGWKKALVALAGPLPGIAAGVLLGVLGLILKHVWLTKAALMLLLVNGFNLLPITPFDGGLSLQATLFCRNRWLDASFRVAAILGLMALGIFGGMKLLGYIAIPMALSLPLVFRLAKASDALRHQALPEPLPDEDRIPIPTAQAIIKALLNVLPAKPVLSHKVLAQHALNIFERLNAKPPGFLGTTVLLLLHGTAFLVTCLMAVVLIVGRHGDLGAFVRAAARQPQHALEPADVQVWPNQAWPDRLPIRTLVVTTLKNSTLSKTAFAELTNRVAPATLVRLGDSLLLSVPADDDAARERWFEEFQARSTNTFVALSNAPVRVSLTCLAPSEKTATNLLAELQEYFGVLGSMHLVSPWSPEAARPEFAAYRRARGQWIAIGQEVAKASDDMSLEPYSEKVAAALKRGARAEVARLGEEQRRKVQELEAQALNRLRTDSARAFDPALLDLHTKLNSAALTNRAVRKAAYRELAGKLGEVAYAGNSPAPGGNACGVANGFVSRHGLLLQMGYLTFYDVTQGLPALADWLHRMGCSHIKYDLVDSGWSSEAGENDDPPEPEN